MRLNAFNILFQYTKIFTVKLQYIFYKERAGIRPGVDLIQLLFIHQDATTLRITTVGIKSLFVTLSITPPCVECHYAECCYV